MSSETYLGQVLHSVRQRRNWTLEQVAVRSGISRSTLSKVERGKLQLTYDKLLKLAHALELEINELFESGRQHAKPAMRRSVGRRNDGIVVETANYLHTYLSGDIMRKQFVPLVVELKARSLEEFGELVRHSGEEFTYVLSGVVELHTEAYAPVRLEVGDSVFFDSTMKHAYLSVGEGNARALSVCTDLDMSDSDSHDELDKVE